MESICYMLLVFTFTFWFLVVLQRKEPVGDNEELPKNIVDGLEDITPEMLEVHF